MPYAEFQPGNAGLALPNFQLQSAEAASSLMERAQRRRIAEQDAEMRKQKHAADMATTDLNQQSLRAEIGMQQIRFKDAERVARQAADTRDEYNRVAPNIDESLSYIQNLTDPFEQRRLMTQLQMKAARFHTDPQVAAMLEKQMSATMSLIDANEKTKLQDYISTTRYAVTEADAKAKFPGQELRLTVRPGRNPGEPPMSFFTPTGRPDPQLEAQALSLLTLARATGDLNKIEAVLQHPSAQQITLVPGNSFSNEYAKAFQAAVELTRKREAEQRARDDQEMQKNKFNREQDALTVDGYEGAAKTESEAKDFRKEQTEIGGVLKGIDEVRKLGKEYLGKSWATDPLKKRQLQELATQQVGMIVGALRIPITGPGAMTDDERKFIARLNGNPTSIFSLSADEFAKLDSMERKFNSHLDLRATNIGLGKRKAQSPGGPSTGGNTVQYNGRSYTVLKPDPNNPGMLLVRDENKRLFRIPDERSRQPAPAQSNSRP